MATARFVVKTYLYAGDFEVAGQRHDEVHLINSTVRKQRSLCWAGYFEVAGPGSRDLAVGKHLSVRSGCRDVSTGINQGLAVGQAISKSVKGECMATARYALIVVNTTCGKRG